MVVSGYYCELGLPGHLRPALRAEEVDMQQVDESKLFDLFAERERPDRKNVVGGLSKKLVTPSRESG